jgi:ABC-type oligopeptide transport system substrate-binding subunit
MRKLLFLFLAASLAAAMATAGCGSSSNQAGAADSGMPDTTVPSMDSGPPPIDGMADTGTVDTGCNFAVFVTGLIKGDASTPSAFLGQGCYDDMDAADFKPLFP